MHQASPLSTMRQRYSPADPLETVQRIIEESDREEELRARKGSTGTRRASVRTQFHDLRRFFEDSAQPPLRVAPSQDPAIAKGTVEARIKLALPDRSIWPRSLQALAKKQGWPITVDPDRVSMWLPEDGCPALRQALGRLRAAAAVHDAFVGELVSALPQAAEFEVHRDVCELTVVTIGLSDVRSALAVIKRFGPLMKVTKRTDAAYRCEIHVRAVVPRGGSAVANP
jgi:hypothetical protein